MAFLDMRLPEDVERGAKGGPGFKTTVLTLTSGAERRNKNWKKSRGNWNIAYGITDAPDLQGVINTFWAVNGSADGFRFKDWQDFQIGDTIGGDTSTKQTIGVGNSAQVIFPIYKTYVRGAGSFNRFLLTPVVGTVRVFLDASEKVENVDYTVGYNTGAITFISAPGGAYASGVLTFTGQPADTETVAIGAKVYTFQTTLTNTDGHVKIGLTTAASISNLIAAINLAAGAGTTYAAATTSNVAGVTAAQGAGTTMNLTANVIGVTGNSIATTETITLGSWAHATLIGGVNLQTVYVMCEFDVPVRFVSDDLPITTEVFNADAIISIPDIDLIELKDIT